MSGDMTKGRRLLARAGCVMMTATAFCGVLLLGVPAFLGGVRQMDMRPVDPSGWMPRHVMELCPADSLPEALRKGGARIFMRYDASAPDAVEIVVNSVIKDGSERKDTVTVSLADEYGRPSGRHGHVMSETVAALDAGGDAEDRRLVEVYPADTVRGVHAVAIMLK